MTEQEKLARLEEMINTGEADTEEGAKAYGELFRSTELYKTFNN